MLCLPHAAVIGAIRSAAEMLLAVAAPVTWRYDVISYFCGARHYERHFLAQRGERYLRERSTGERLRDACYYSAQNTPLRAPRALRGQRCATAIRAFVTHV